MRRITSAKVTLSNQCRGGSREGDPGGQDPFFWRTPKLHKERGGGEMLRLDYGGLGLIW